jgi:hypothetical protein
MFGRRGLAPFRAVPQRNPSSVPPVNDGRPGTAKEIQDAIRHFHVHDFHEYLFRKVLNDNQKRTLTIEGKTLASIVLSTVHSSYAVNLIDLIGENYEKQVLEELFSSSSILRYPALFRKFLNSDDVLEEMLVGVQKLSGVPYFLACTKFCDEERVVDALDRLLSKDLDAMREGADWSGPVSSLLRSQYEDVISGVLGVEALLQLIEAIAKYTRSPYKLRIIIDNLMGIDDAEFLRDCLESIPVTPEWQLLCERILVEQASMWLEEEWGCVLFSAVIMDNLLRISLLS